MRKFFLVFSKYETVSGILQNNDNQLIETQQMPLSKSPVFRLSWSHYLILMGLENEIERSFYEIEVVFKNKNTRQFM